MVIELIALKKNGLNGRIGILCSFNSDKGRWKVLVEKELCYLLVKPENMKIVEDETYKSPDSCTSLVHIRPKAWEIWAGLDDTFTVEKIKIGSTEEVPLMGLFHFPMNARNPNQHTERNWLRKVRGWKDPQGFSPVDGFFTDGGQDGKYLYYDNGDCTGPINHWANHVKHLTPYYRLQQLPNFQEGGIHGNVIVMSSPHMGHEFRTYTAQQLRKWMQSLCTDQGDSLSRDNTPGSQASFASMMADVGGVPNTGFGFFNTVSGNMENI